MAELGLFPLFAAALLGLATTSSSLVGAALGLYANLSEKGLACVLGFAAGALISALAIELAFETAQTLHSRGQNVNAAWAFVGGGFALGALIYYRAALYLEGKGAAIRYRTRFREFAQQRKREETQELIKLLSRCDLLRHLPPQDIQELLPLIREQPATAGTVLFRKGDPADALYIIARGEVDILGEPDPLSREEHRIALARWRCSTAESGRPRPGRRSIPSYCRSTKAISTTSSSSIRSWHGRSSGSATVGLSAI
jgi:hypothetical protein